MDHNELREDLLPLRAVHHVELYCGNAKQSAYYYRQAFGFSLVGYQGPETGVRDRVSYVLQQGKVRFVLTTPILLDGIIPFLSKHGDSVRDIALETTDAEFCFRETVKRGATPVREPELLEDAFGTVKIATVATYGDTVHSFIERNSYNGLFLPGFQATGEDNLARPVGLKHIDHIVGNVDWNQMEQWVQFYIDVFGFSRFVSFDDKDISTEYSALRSTVVSNNNKWIKFPINEPAEGKKKSQIEEYIEFYRGEGMQHVAMATKNILKTVAALRKRGVEFLTVPESYYETVPERVGHIEENLDEIRALNILVDSDDEGYLLQIFTKPVEDRPTVFYEIIQRKGAKSFGKGNF